MGLGVLALLLLLFGLAVPVLDQQCFPQILLQAQLQVVPVLGSVFLLLLLLSLLLQ
jgi:hypothetical protein